LYRLYLLIRRHKDNVRRRDGSRKAKGIIHVVTSFDFAIAIAIATLCIEGIINVNRIPYLIS
jgi:hypothetical protein